MQHMIIIPVRLNDTFESQMILDTGIGLTLITKEFCERVKCNISGSYTGKRMSGQKIKVGLSRIAVLSIAGHREENVQVGVFDTANILPPNIDGMVSLAYFEKTPFTIDNKNGVVIVEDPMSMAERKKNGAIVPVTVDRDGPTVGLYLSMEVPNGPPAKVEIDTGSNSFILNEKYMKRLGVDPKGPTVKRVDAKDETAHPYTRYFTKIAGPIYPTGAPQMRQADLDVMFQKIIYDGLVGHGFLKNFIVTFDIPNAQIILAKP